MNGAAALAQPDVRVAYPDWMDRVVGDWGRVYATDAETMRLAIALSRENVVTRSGGPFGAAIFELTTGRLVAAGMNSVVRLHNCTLHGEMVAFMMAYRYLEDRGITIVRQVLRDEAREVLELYRTSQGTIYNG